VPVRAGACHFSLAPIPRVRVRNAHACARVARCPILPGSLPMVDQQEGPQLPQDGLGALPRGKGAGEGVQGRTGALRAILASRKILMFLPVSPCIG